MLRPEDLVEQKVCIVTGGAQGFGAGIAKTLASDRANVVIADLNEEDRVVPHTNLKENSSWEK